MELKVSNWVFLFPSLFLITLFLILKKSQSRISGKQPPPGPPAWPVVGNIFDLGSKPHQKLYKLRFKYGDLLWLKLGWSNNLVIQTAKASEELFKNHDATFCDRQAPQASTAHNYHQGSLVACPYGSDWRVLRRLVTVGLMTGKKIQETLSVRRKCIDNMIHFIEDDSTAAKERGESGEIRLSKYVFVMTFNLMGNLVLSRDLINSQSEEGNEFFHAMEKVTKLSGKPNLADFYPCLRRLDPQRIKKNMEIHLGRVLSIVEKFVKERIEDRKLKRERDTNDLLDTFLDYFESGADGSEGHEAISNHNMLIIIVEMFFSGTETTSTTIEWVMAELFRNPESLRMLREELNRVVGPGRKVEESHVDKLPYLQAVVKEAMRLHPVIPFLIPRNVMEDTNLMGYFIPKGTRVFVNAWGIGRDPEAWEDPLSFKPERFMGSNIQYLGQNFELIPFGAGRRICVGYPLAHQILHLTVASLVHCFDWEFDSKSVADAMDMNERFGITVRKLIPLKAIPKKMIMA